MVKPKVAKIFKVVKKTVDNKDQLVVRYKHVDNKDVKVLKKLLNATCQRFVETLPIPGQEIVPEQ